MNNSNELMSVQNQSEISCPFCKKNDYQKWAIENNFTLVKCLECGILYLNPIPSLQYIEKSVSTGIHDFGESKISVVTRRISSKVSYYEKRFRSMFNDLLKKEGLKWLDVGAGYGEVMQAVEKFSSGKIKAYGIEPMKPKVKYAKKLGIDISLGYLDKVEGKYDIISFINVFSHVPDFRLILSQMKERLSPQGEIYLETGNAADCQRTEIPGILSLPDHLIFAGERHINSYLEEAGFEIINIKRVRVDTFMKLLKNVVKVIIGQKLPISLPYTSSYRSLQIRARLK